MTVDLGFSISLAIGLVLAELVTTLGCVIVEWLRGKHA